MSNEQIKKLKKIGSTQLIAKLQNPKTDEETKKAIIEVLTQRGVEIPEVEIEKQPTEKQPTEKQPKTKKSREIIPLAEELKAKKEELSLNIGNRATFTPHRHDFEVEGVIVAIGINRKNNTFFFFIKSEDKRLKKPVHAKRINKVTILS